jgi:hypothetical protein
MFLLLAEANAKAVPQGTIHGSERERCTPPLSTLIRAAAAGALRQEFCTAFEGKMGNPTADEPDHAAALDAHGVGSPTSDPRQLNASVHALPRLSENCCPFHATITSPISASLCGFESAHCAKRCNIGGQFVVRG